MTAPCGSPRPALIADTAAVVALDKTIGTTPLGDGRIARGCAGADGQWVFVVEADAGSMDERNGHGGHIGYIVLSQTLDEVTVLALGVRAGYRGQGLAGKLLDCALAQVAAGGACRCLLEVRQSNLTARRLYSSRGFSVDGVRARYYPAPNGREDGLLMSKKL